MVKYSLGREKIKVAKKNSLQSLLQDEAREITLASSREDVALKAQEYLNTLNVAEKLGVFTESELDKFHKEYLERTKIKSAVYENK